MVISFINLKGGTGKSTSAVMMSTCLARAGETLLVDMESHGTASSWHEEAEGLPFNSVEIPSEDITDHIDILRADYQHIVIDTPAVVRSMARAAVTVSDVVIIPIKPSIVDIDRLQENLDVIAEANHQGSLYALITQQRKRTRNAQEMPEALQSLDVDVFKTGIPMREAYIHAFGTVPKASELEPYRDVVKELNRREGQRRRQ